MYMWVTLLAIFELRSIQIIHQILGLAAEISLISVPEVLEYPNVPNFSKIL